MRLKWGEEKIRGFSNPLKKVEEVNELGWWGLFVVIVLMGIAFILKIYGKI
ncbi:hypothetical protein ES705_46016 [subsurface metagenome]